MSQREELASQFTEDILAKRVYNCDRQSCDARINIGEPRHYIASQDPNQSGWYVCAACYQHYRSSRNLSMTIRKLPATFVPKVQDDSRKGAVDFTEIRDRVNESQRKGVHSAVGRVTPMLPPPLPLPRYSDPVVANPSHLHGYFNAVQQPLSSTGYSAAHQQWGSERGRWAGYARIPRKAQQRVSLSGIINQIPIIAQVMYLASGAKKAESINPRSSLY
ncbi:hypothetical protein FPV67DRAFT_1676774 [Lyophyllum atratum]|nr:hypothetical protein FPV67DRAFT_1676774 [Lyophyllum atratum]